MDLLRREVPATRLVVAIDPGKALNRVWLTTGERGLIGEPVSLPVLRDGVERARAADRRERRAGAPVIGLEATGALHRAWAAELERRWPGSLRLFAPSETHGGAGAARVAAVQDRRPRLRGAGLAGCARARAGRREPRRGRGDAGRRSRHRRQLVDARASRCSSACMTSSTRSCPGLSAPAGHGRALELETPTGQAVLACAARSPAAPPSARSLLARAPGRLTDGDRARSGRRAGSGCLAPPRRRRAARRSDWAATCAAGRRCATTSRSSRTSSSALLARQRRPGPDDACPASRSSAPRRSPPTRCRSSASRRPSTSTRRPAWRRPATSPRRSRRRGADQPHRACPSTATR